MPRDGDSHFVTLLQHATNGRRADDALVGLSATLSHGALLDQVRRAAWHVAAAVPPGGAIAASLAATPAHVALQLGCLASGRMSIFLDPLDDGPRNDAILEDARPHAVLRADAAAALLQAGEPPPGFPPPLAPDAAATVHFTSGSTGRPKGVAIGLPALLARIDDGYAYTAATRALPTSYVNVSAGLCAHLGPLLAGGAVLVAHLPTVGATPVLRLMRDGRANCFSAGPAILRMLARLPGAAAAFAEVRLIRSGGAGMSGADLAAWRDVLPAGCRILHRYASTEAGLVAQWETPPAWPGVLPAGRLLPGRRLLVQDASGAEVPAGEVGELVVGGRHMALGDWQQGRIVPDRLPADPDHPGEQLFRTGDCGRIDADGLVHFVSRADRQIKINGARIEPAEIEAVLRGHPAVTDAAVVAVRRPSRTGAGADLNPLTLHGFVASAGPPQELEAELMALLGSALPAVMRPARLSIVTALPRLPGGKADHSVMSAVADRSAASLPHG